MAFNKYFPAGPAQSLQSRHKVGRNNPCPCGSGLK
ncbi:MAG: SEC-C metal-binding domain-containing protein [Proteobacteria bacterium]|nr:SEC-C metal-binding domain-containing protein [Pseudomonadota bacterium]